jgi:hypothetical protein
VRHPFGIRQQAGEPRGHAFELGFVIARVGLFQIAERRQ